MSNALNPFAPPVTLTEAAPSLLVDPRRLAGVETGLRLVYYGIVLILICFIAMVLSAIFPPAVALLVGGVFFGWLLTIIGPFFCLTAPSETNARGLIVGSISCQILAFSVSVAGAIVPVARLVSSTSSLFSLAGSALFVMFLMKIARHLHQADLHQRGRNILIGACILFVISIMVAVGIAVIGPAVGIVMFAVSVGFIILFVMYANLLSSLYKVIARLRRTAGPAIQSETAEG